MGPLAAMAVTAAILFILNPFRHPAFDTPIGRLTTGRGAHIGAAAVVLPWAALLLFFGVGGLASLGLWFGVGLIAAATLGLHALLVSALRQDKPAEVFIAVFVALAVPLYVVRPSIWFDQPWASRRLMGFALFGLFLLAAIGLHQLANVGQTQMSIVSGQAAAGVLAVMMLVPILAPLPDALRHSPRAGELEMVLSICDALEGADKVVVSGSVHLGFPVRAFCGQPTVYIDLTSDQVDSLVEISRLNGELVGFVVPFAQAPVVQRVLSDDATATRIQTAVGPQMAPFHEIADRRTLARLRLTMQTELHDLLVVVDAKS